MYVCPPFLGLSFSIVGDLKDTPQEVDQQCWVIFWGNLPWLICGFCTSVLSCLNWLLVLTFLIPQHKFSGVCVCILHTSHLQYKLGLAVVWLFSRKDPEEDHLQEASHLAALQTVAAEMSPVSVLKIFTYNQNLELIVDHNEQVSPGNGSIGLPTSSSNYMEVPTTSNPNSGLVASNSSSTYIEMPTTTSSTSTSSGLPTTTSNHTNVTSLHRCTNSHPRYFYGQNNFFDPSASSFLFFCGLIWKNAIPRKVLLSIKY